LFLLDFLIILSVIFCFYFFCLILVNIEEFFLRVNILNFIFIFLGVGVPRASLPVEGAGTGEAGAGARRRGGSFGGKNNHTQTARVQTSRSARFVPLGGAFVPSRSTAMFPCRSTMSGS
jgi:hypothetical protein